MHAYAHHDAPGAHHDACRALPLQARAHHDALPSPQEQAYRALSSVCQGNGPEGRARRVRAMDSGVLDAARSSMSIFGYEAPPHAEAVRTLIVIISGVDSMGKARQHRAADH